MQHRSGVQVKDYLCEQLWARMSQDGLQVLEPQAIMRSWSEAYAANRRRSSDGLPYTSPIPEFEDRIHGIKADSESTVISPVLRVGEVRACGTVHQGASAGKERDLNAFLQAAACKRLTPARTYRSMCSPAMRCFMTQGISRISK